MLQNYVLETQSSITLFHFLTKAHGHVFNAVFCLNFLTSGSLNFDEYKAGDVLQIFHINTSSIWIKKPSKLHGSGI